YRIAAREVDRRVDRDEAVAVPSARVLVAARQPTEPPEELGDAGALGASAAFDVGQWTGDRDLDASPQNVERRRALFARPADDVSCAEPSADDRAAVESQERAGRAGEHGKVEQLPGADLLAFEQIDIERALVGEGPRGTADHTLATAHAARLAHGHV